MDQVDQWLPTGKPGLRRRERANRSKSPRPAYRVLPWLLAFIGLLGVIPGGVVSSQDGAARQVDSHPLLADPLPARAEFQFLGQWRSWLSIQNGRLEAFEQAAQELAQPGAYFAAIEILWFAEKLTDDPAKQEAYVVQSEAWLKLAQPADRLVEEGQQLFAAGRREEALLRFEDALALNPYCEKAHYQIADANFAIYLSQDEAADRPLPVAYRSRLFREAYERSNYALALDPILYDAYYLLSNLREMLADDPQFLQASQPMTDRALTFRTEVVPPMARIENGGRDAALFVALGDGLEEVGLFDYAVYAYQIAIARGSTEPEIAQRLQALLEKHFTP